MYKKVISIISDHPSKQELKEVISILKHICRAYTDDFIGFCLDSRSKPLSKQAMNFLRSNNVLASNGKIKKQVHATIIKLITFPHDNVYMKGIFFKAFVHDYPLFIAYKDPYSHYNLMDEFIVVDIDLADQNNAKYKLESILNSYKVVISNNKIHSAYILPKDW